MKPEVFLTLREAIDLINSDTPTNPTVDHKKLAKASAFLDANQRGGEMNFNLFPVGLNDEGKIVKKPAVYARISGPREANELKYAIQDHYTEISGKKIDFEALSLYKKTTTIEDKSNFQAAPRDNPNSTLKAGDELATGEGTQMVGA